MAWNLRFARSTQKELKALEPQIQKRIISFLEDLIDSEVDPRANATKLQGRWYGLWRHRVGNHRIIFEVNGEILEVLVVRIGDRKDVYT